MKKTPTPRVPKVEKSAVFKGELLLKDDKWKLASHLQKSVRRGKPEEAAQAVSALVAIDAAYARYRMAVIMVEDVAAGSPEAAWEVACSGWKKADVDGRGGAAFLEDSARVLASLVKDRTPCQAISCTRWLGHAEEVMGPFEEWTFDRSSKVAFDAAQPWHLRALSAWRCIGTDRVKSENLPIAAGDHVRWCGLVEEQLGQVAANWVRWGLQYQGEAHPIGLALAWSGQKESPVVIREPVLTDLGAAGPWVSEALDRHTSEGKSALYRAMDRADAWRWFAARGLGRDDAFDAIGRLWFWVEGGQCSPHLDYALARKVDFDIKQEFLTRTGLNGRELMEAWGGMDMSVRLAQARQEVVGKVRQRPPGP